MYKKCYQTGYLFEVPIDPLVNLFTSRHSTKKNEIFWNRQRKDSLFGSAFLYKMERKQTMTGIQQKRKSVKIFKNRRKVVPVLIKKKGQSELWSTTQPAPRYTIDYKNTKLLVKFISPQGKILSRRATGLTAKQQRVMANTIKRARMGGLIPFVNYEMGPQK